MPLPYVIRDVAALDAGAIDSGYAGLYCPRQHVTQVSNTALTLFMRPDPSQCGGAGRRCIYACIPGRVYGHTPACCQVALLAKIQTIAVACCALKPGGVVCLCAGYF
jgi:hypothetical protein